MTEEQKREQLDFLYRQLDTCGQILAEWDDDRPPTQYRRDYRRILKSIVALEPEKWKDYPAFQKKDYTNRDAAVERFCEQHPCRKCGGKTRQTRSGSLRIICTSCGQKYQLKTQK